MIILCWTTKVDGLTVDHYTTFESLIDATSAYKTVRAEPHLQRYAVQALRVNRTALRRRLPYAYFYDYRRV